MSRLTALMHALRTQFGARCDLCGATKQLEFAHITPTGLNGEGRGGLKRAYDIRRHPSSYRLLCRPCHLRYDRFIRECHKLRIRVHGRWYLGQPTHRSQS